MSPIPVQLIPEIPLRLPQEMLAPVGTNGSTGGREPNPSLVDKSALQLPDVSKFEGSVSVPCHPAEHEWEMEPPEAAVLRAKYLLVQRWLQRMDEGHHSADCLRDGHLPRSGTSPPCHLDYENSKKFEVNLIGRDTSV